MSMTSQERVLTAMNLAQPDRVPMDFQANRWVLERLHRDLGTTTHRELLTRLRSDIVDLRGVVEPLYCGPVPWVREREGGLHENFWGWRQKSVLTASGPEECFAEFALENAESIEDLQRHPWPEVEWFDFTGFHARLAEWRGFAVMATGASVFQHATFLRRFDQLLVDMAVNPEMAHWLLDRFTGFYLAFFDRMLTAAQGAIDILRVADDLGSQQSLFISPEMFRIFVKPRLRALIEMTHSHGVKFMFHSCGAIRPLIEDLIEIGVDLLDPLQAAAEGMEPHGLKLSFGSRIALHGGICTQYLLPQGTPEEVAGEVRRRAAVLGAGGGYILAPCHVLQSDVPTANILALSEALAPQ